MDLSISAELTPCNNIIEIDRKTNSVLHDEVYKIAKYFKEELNYDSVPYSSFGMPTGEHKALLFTEEAVDEYKKDPMPYRIYGACLFTEIKCTDGGFWKLKWIWFHPFFRNRGNLKKHWPALEDSFGNFIISKPVSSDMSAFLEYSNSKYKHRTM